jgi:hypothetical protein
MNYVRVREMVRGFVILFLFMFTSVHSEAKISAACHRVFDPSYVDPLHVALEKRILSVIAEDSVFEFEPLDLTSSSLGLQPDFWRQMISDIDSAYRSLLDDIKDNEQVDDIELSTLEFQQLHNFSGYIHSTGHKPLLSFRFGLSPVVVGFDDQNHAIAEWRTGTIPHYLFLIFKNYQKGLLTRLRRREWILLFDPGAQYGKDVIFWKEKIRIVGLTKLYEILESKTQWTIDDIPFVAPDLSPMGKKSRTRKMDKTNSTRH